MAEQYPMLLSSSLFREVISSKNPRHTQDVFMNTLQRLRDSVSTATNHTKMFSMLP